MGDCSPFGAPQWQAWSRAAGQSAAVQRTTLDIAYVVAGGGRDGNNYWNPVTFDFTRNCNNIVQLDWGTIGGGIANTSNGEAATVAGGSSNSALSHKSTVSGGFNYVAGAESAQVAGGEYNRASGASSNVGGGTGNTASNAHAVVGGGESNVASGQRATVSGGHLNVASGQDATIPGECFNWAPADKSFAAGHRAKSLNKGCFTWADSTDTDFSCGIDDGFAARALGGFYLVTGQNPATGVISWGCSTQVGVGWSCTSDRNAKERFEPVDGGEVLRRLAATPLYYWSAKGQDGKVRHLGPMAQDFIAAFAVSDNDRMIGMQDADGVALAAIQRLHEQVKQRDAQIDELKAEVAQLRGVHAELAELKRAVEILMVRTSADRALAAR